MKTTPVLCLAMASLQSQATAETIAEINGNKFISPYWGKAVTNVTGLLTAKGPNGIFIRSAILDNHKNTSESIYIFNSSIGANLVVGDIVSLDGKVSEYRSTNT
jgi:predicted extracellular nuclease